MTPATTDTSVITEADWAQREFAAVAGHLADLIEGVPSTDADPEVKAHAIGVAERAARSIAHQFPTQPTGRPAREFLAALREVRASLPRAKVRTPEGPPQSTTAAAKLASALATNPELAKDLPDDLAAAHDALLGRPVLAQYAAAIDEARAQLVSDAVEVLTRIPADWRRAAGAPTPDEAAGLDRLREIGLGA